MRAVPAEGRIFDLTPMQDLVSSRRRLGMNLPTSGSGYERCSCKGRPPLDAYHLETCKMGGAATRVHNELNAEVVQMFREAGLYASIGGHRLFPGRLPGAKPIADGFAYGGGRTVVLDTTVRHHLVDPAATAASPLAAATAGENEKFEQYGALCRENGFDMLPAAFVSSGAMGAQLASELKSLGERVAAASPTGGDPKELARAFVERWRTRFSCCLNKAFASKIAQHSLHFKIPLAFSAPASPGE